MRPRRYSRLLMLLAGFPIAGTAEVDPVHLRLLDQYEQPLRWDNVERRATDNDPFWQREDFPWLGPSSPPYWRGGVPPQPNVDDAWQSVTLGKGEQITVFVPAGEMLRLVSRSGEIAGLQAAFSQDGRLYVEQSPQRSRDGRDWVYRAPALQGILVRLSRERDAPGMKSDFALFVSRRESLAAIAPYRSVLPLNDARIDLRPGLSAAGQAYWLLAAGKATTLPVRGPARLALAARLIYPAQESRPQQHWTVRAHLDQKPLPAWTVETGSETSAPVFIDGVATPVSREKETYFEIPEGEHVLRLDSSATLAARLLEQEVTDYLLPALNEPRVPAHKVRADMPALPLKLATELSSPSKALAPLRDAAADPADVRQAALHLAQDRRLREGGLLATAAMLNAGERRRDDPSVGVEALEMRGLFTFYRDLLPSNKAAPGEIRFAWFHSPRLAHIGEVGRQLSVFEQHADDLLGALESGLFLPIPARATAGKAPPTAMLVQAYRLPARPAASWLRVAVTGSRAQAIFVQFDEQAPRRLTFSPEAAVAGDAFAPSTAAAGLELFRHQHGRLGDGTLSAAFSRLQTPAQRVSAGVFDLELPRSVSEIRVWRETEGAAHSDEAELPRMALKLRVSKPWQLSERAYHEAATRVPKRDDQLDAAFVAALRPSNREAEEDLAWHALDQHWQDLARLLRSQAKIFFAGVPDRTNPPTLPGSPAKALSEAETHRQSGDWLAALEAWSEAYAHAEASARREIQQRRLEALEHLGEDFLLEQYLRQELRDGETPAARESARAWLKRRARQDDDRDALRALALAAAALEPTPESLRRLADALLATDEYALALQTALLLPSADQPLETLAQASFALRWWDLFDRTLARIADPGRRAFWLGQRHFASGRAAEAIVAWRSGDALARAYARHAESTPKQATSAPSPQDIARWADWQHKHPGARQWRDVPGLVVDAAGSESLYQLDRDIVAAAWLARPERPVKARFHGPLRLRVDARLLHANGKPQPRDGWIRVRSPDQLWVQAISNNLPAPALELVGQTGQLPGRKETLEIDFAAGWHEIEVDGESQELLIRLEVATPTLPIATLPLLTRDTSTTMPPFEAAAQIGNDLPGQTTTTNWRETHIGCRDCTVSVAPGTSSPSVRTPENHATYWQNTPLSPAATAFSQLPEANRIPPERDTIAADLAAARWESLLSLPEPANAEAVRRQLGVYAWMSEHALDLYPKVLARAQALAAAHPEVAGAQALLGRISRKSGWTPLASVESSAGLRAVAIDRWTPESPALRVRRALLTPVQAQEQLLSGDSQLVLALFNPAATQLDIHLSSEDAGPLLPGPMDVTVLLDDQPWQKVHLTAEQPRAKLALTVPPGRHALRLQIGQAFANQFLRVRFDEGRLPLAGERSERFYHVAQTGAPVRVRLPGPNWLRIDEWHDGRVRSQYRHLDRDWQEITLAPSAERAESLYRLHLRTPQADRREATPRMSAIASDPVPLPDLSLDAPEHRSPITLADGLALGGQEDGTWSLGIGLKQRPYAAEDAGFKRRVNSAQQALQSVDPLAAARTQSGVDALLGRGDERYLEGSAVWRHFDADKQHYRRLDLIGRLREQGGPTLGLRALIAFVPNWSPWNATLETRWFTQAPGGGQETLLIPGGLLGSPGTAITHQTRAPRREWSGQIIGSLSQKRDIDPKTWHTPKFSAFMRRTSLQGFASALPPYRSGRVDQDVYTPYLSEHDRGLEFADTLFHRPWLDTLWYAGASLTTDEDLNPGRPDHIAQRIGWKQLLGRGWLDAGWNRTDYRPGPQRASPSQSRDVHLQGGIDLWQGPWHRIELAATARYSLDGGGHALLLQLFWHFGNGRGYLDFRPGEIDFRELRERLRPSQPNNHVSDPQ